MTKQEKKKNPHAQAMVRLRVKKQTPERRKEIARNAVITRWNKVKKLSTDNTSVSI